MSIPLVPLVLAVVIGWKLFQLSKHPSDGSLWSVILCLVCVAASVCLAMPSIALSPDTVAGNNALKLVQNLLLLGACYFLLCFYLYSAADDGRSRRRARREGVAVLTVSVAASVLAGTAPHGDLASTVNSAAMATPPVAMFYLITGMYMCYGLIAAGVWTRRYAQMSQRPHATGLWMAATGVFTMATACAVRAGIVLIRWLFGPMPALVSTTAALLVVGGMLLFMVGITYSGVRSRATAARIWRQHRRIYQRLEPLWLLLSEAYPETVLTSADTSWWERCRARDVHRRYHRRVVECRDCLVRISPYLDYPHEQGTVLDLTPEDLARRLCAVALEVEVQIPEPRRAIPLAIPNMEDPDPEADVRQLISLADALRVVKP